MIKLENVSTNRLINYVKQNAVENECTDIYLTVNEENVRAIKTYEKFGMKVKNIAYSMQIDGDDKKWKN